MTITTPSACTPLDGALRIPVTLIEPSPLNPRKTWRPERVAAMAADMKGQGQIQPIRVRPNPRATGSNGRPPYEIVVGETRWRAAPDAGLATLDAIVADCTDHQLIQLALAENTKRADLNALEEADAYDALLRKPDGLQGYASVQQLAAAVAVSPSHVYQRLKLRNLCTQAREAFLAGQIDASVAVLIARMPDQTEQARATARIVTGFGGEPYSYRQASEMLRKEFMLRLDLARFDIAAAYKVAGPCSECNKRSGAAPDLFADVSGGDMCQDARCYQAKAEEAHQVLLQVAREAGRTVLQGAKARAILRDANAEPVGHYRLDRPCPALTDSARPLHALLGQGFAGSIVLVDLGETVTPVELVPVEVARKAIKARGLLRKQTAEKPAPAPSPAAKAGAPLFKPKAPAPAPAPSPAGPSAQAGGGEAEKPRDLAVPKLKAPQDDEDLRRRVRLKFGQLVMTELAMDLEDAAELPLEILRVVLRAMWADLAAEECELVWIACCSGTVPKRYDVAFDELVSGCSGRKLGELLALLAAVPYCTDEHLSFEDFADTPAAKLARHFGASLDRTLSMARVATKGAAVDDATAAFVAAHSPAGGADEVRRPAAGESAKASAPDGDTAEAWQYPTNEFGPRG